MRTQTTNRVHALTAVLLALAVLIGAVTSVPSRDALRLRAGATNAFRLLATQTALIMQGTFYPFVSPAWVSQVMGAFVDPVRDDFTGVALDTPEQFWPVTGITSMTFNSSIQEGYAILDERVDQTLASEGFRTPVNVFGYSQSAVIASVKKRDLDLEYANRKDVPAVTFTMIGNPLRPNGGFLSRFGLANAVLTPSIDMRSTPTDTPYSTVDIARQYDVWADFPTYPLNLLSTINAMFGTWNHWYLPESLPPGFYSNVIETVSLDPTSPDYVPGTTSQVYGDTTYYMIPSEHLPMYYPLRWLGLGPLVDVIEPLTKVLVELGYDRTTSYGEQTRMRLIPEIGNLAHAGQFVTDVGQALEQGGQALVDLFTPPPASPVTGGPDPLPVSSAAAVPADVPPSPPAEAEDDVPPSPPVEAEDDATQTRTRSAVRETPPSDSVSSTPGISEPDTNLPADSAAPAEAVEPEAPTRAAREQRSGATSELRDRGRPDSGDRRGSRRAAA